MEAEISLGAGFQRLPIFPRGFQQHLRADNIGADEFCRAINGTIHMGFGGQMHDALRIEAGEGIAHRGGITNIQRQMLMARRFQQIAKGIRARGVGEFIDVHHSGVGGGQQMPHHCRPDKAHTTCQKNDHEAPHPLKMPECTFIRTSLYVSSMTKRYPALVRYSSRRRNPDWSCCISACPTGIPSHPAYPLGSGYGAAPTSWIACRDPPAILPCGYRIW